MGFEWVEGALTGLVGVEPSEVLQALSNERRWPRMAVDPVLGLTALAIWSRTAAGRPLLVLVRQTGTWDWQIVAARALRPGEVQEFEEWEGTR